MLRFVLDEDMPRSAGRMLFEKGFTVSDIRDYGLRGASDKEVLQFAQQHEAVLLSGDIGFGNIVKLPLGSHFGIVIVHFPNKMPVTEINRQLVAALSDLDEKEFKSNLIIIEPGRIRIRRAISEKH